MKQQGGVNYYPLALNISGQRVVVVGGGGVAVRKINTLVAYGAKVQVVSLAPRPELTELAKDGTISLLERGYKLGDLAGAVLVFAATGKAAVNAQVAAAARAIGSHVNVIDGPDAGDFILPALVRQGPLTVAISTGGSSPALARLLRIKAEQFFGPEYGPFCELLARERVNVLAQVADISRRREIFRALASEDLLELVKQEDQPAIAQYIASCYEQCKGTK